MVVVDLLKSSLNGLCVSRHVMEIRQAATPHLSSCRSTAIVHIYHPFTLQIVLLHSLNLRRYLGKKICALYKSFSKIDSVGHHY